MQQALNMPPTHLNTPSSYKNGMIHKVRRSPVSLCLNMGGTLLPSPLSLSGLGTGSFVPGYFFPALRSTCSE